MNPTKLLALASLLAFSQIAHAQKTTGDIIAENWERGRRMREAMESTKAQPPPLAPPALSATSEPPASSSAIPSGVFMFFLNSRNGVPRIVVTAFTPNRCGKPWKMAATLDKDGKSETGCFKVEPGSGTFTVDWDNYGLRTYSIAEWWAEVPGDADHKALGQ